jgi:hypothetical protein
MSKSIQMSPVLQRMLGRTMVDPEFRAGLIRDPEAVLRDAGLDPADPDMARLVDHIKRSGAELELGGRAELKGVW